MASQGLNTGTPSSRRLEKSVTRRTSLFYGPPRREPGDRMISYFLNCWAFFKFVEFRVFFRILIQIFWNLLCEINCVGEIADLLDIFAFSSQCLFHFGFLFSILFPIYFISTETLQCDPERVTSFFIEQNKALY